MRSAPTRTLLTTAVAIVLAVVLGAATVDTDAATSDLGRRAAAVASPAAAALPATVGSPATAAGPLPPPTRAQRPPAPRPVVDRSRALVVARPAPTRSPEGWLVAGGGGVDPVDDTGRVVRWTFEVEDGLDVDLAAAADAAERALHDPRSWAREHTLERVDSPDDARVRILVARPATVDRLCARAGLATNGYFSCWNGRVAAINHDRWSAGVDHIDDLALYRAYVVNHEVGHALGHDHRGCAGAGTTAHVMQQQTRTLAGCVANPWPHPAG